MLLSQKTSSAAGISTEVSKMNLVVIVIAFLAVCQANSTNDDEKRIWENFKIQHQKSYMNEAEEMRRMRIFLINREKINAHNDRYNKGYTTFKMDVNEFADLEHEEFVGAMLGFNKTMLEHKMLGEGIKYVPPVGVKVADTMDWRTQGYVTEIKNQGPCGSCWAFSATGSLEGQHFKSTGQLVSLSEQNLMDCSSSYGNQGCNGGWMNNAFQYIIDNGGIDTEASYPYQAMTGTCRYQAANSGATCRSYTSLPYGDENSLMTASGTVGPISVAMDAGRSSFQFYSSGVYYDSTCSSTSLNHGVLVVGYGTSSGQDYWLIKNSWGTSWGLSGYFMIARNMNNQCGISSYPSYPNV